MRALLVYPVPPRSHWPRGVFRSYWVPTGLAYLAAALKKAGHDVRVHCREETLIRLRFDWAAADASLRELLAEFRPELVGLSTVTPALGEAQEIAALAKRICGEHVLTVAGGPHPSALPEETLQDCPDVDVAVVGEAEATLVELADQGPSDSVGAIAFRKDGGIVRTARRDPPGDLDALGPPAYDLFDMAHYTRANPWLLRWLNLRGTNVRATRGCTNRCRFCGGHLVSGLGVRFHSIPYVIQQVSHLVRRHDLQSVTFEDETLGADPRYLADLCEAIKHADLHRRICWTGCLRADQVDRALLAQMKLAGCVQIEYGFESGSDRSLRALGKNTTVEQNHRAVRLTREAKMRVFANIMVGLPGETEQDLRATERFVRRARPDVINVARLAPLPGTDVFAKLPAQVRQGLAWEKFAYFDEAEPLANLTAMSDAQFQRAWRRFEKYCVRPLLARELLRDTPPQDRRGREFYRKIVRRFWLRHPIRAGRLFL